MIGNKRGLSALRDRKAVEAMTGKAKTRRRRVLRRIIITLIVLALLAGTGWFAYSSLKAEYTVTYDTYTATRGSISNALSFYGNLSLVDSATYAASSTGTVKTAYVAVNDEVAEGDKLIRLNNGETITADFPGRVNKLNVQEGDEATQGQELVQIADFSHLQISFRVDEYDISDVHVGDACTVTVTALEKSFDTTIDAIDHISSSGGNVAYYTATAYVDVDDPNVLPGMQVTVSITQQETTDAVILKVDAVSFDMLGGDALDIGLKDGAPFTAVIGDDTLTLTAEYGSTWLLNGLSLKRLYNSGIETILLKTNEWQGELATDQVLQGEIYARLRTEGVPSSDFYYTISSEGVRVAVNGETYRLDDDNVLIPLEGD